MMQLETEQRVGAQGYKKRRKKKKKKKPKTEQCKREASFSPENAVFFHRKNLCVYLFAARLLGGTKSSQNRADHLGEFLR